MKIAIRGGHNYGVVGASGIVSEVEKDREIYPKVIEWLKIDGHEVLDVTTNRTETRSQDLSYGVSRANNWGADYFCSIHLNCFNSVAKGTEVLYQSEKGKEIATRISSKIAELGFQNRGAKPNTRGLYELNNTKMVANIIETFFCDNQSDVDLYNSVGVDAIAKKIVEGIVGHDIKIPEPPQPTPILKYCAQIQNIGWQKEVLANTDEFAGTVGQSLRLEALIVNLENTNGNVIVEGHIQNRGFQSIRYNGEVVGTIGQSLRLECIKMHLEGVDGYKIQYRSHCENIGWTEWVENGAECGTTGKGLRIEAIQIRLVKS